MSAYPSRFAKMADPDHTRPFRRRWADRPMSSREIERASEIAAAANNWRLAERLAWQAHKTRTEAGR